MVLNVLASKSSLMLPVNRSAFAEDCHIAANQQACMNAMYAFIDLLNVWHIYSAIVRLQWYALCSKKQQQNVWCRLLACSKQLQGDLCIAKHVCHACAVFA